MFIIRLCLPDGCSKKSCDTAGGIRKPGLSLRLILDSSFPKALHPYRHHPSHYMELESDIGDLAHYLVNQLLGGSAHPKPRRLLVGISGMPASGKTMFAQILTEQINYILLE